MRGPQSTRSTAGPGASTPRQPHATAAQAPGGQPLSSDRPAARTADPAKEVQDTPHIGDDRRPPGAGGAWTTDRGPTPAPRGSDEGQIALDFRRPDRSYPDWYHRPRDEKEERFVEFHRANPQVYAELERLALDWWRAGAGRIGIRCLWETLRYDHRMKVARIGGDPWKMNDHYCPMYARLLIHRHSYLDDVIETRARQIA